ncbi:hypothetical protein ACGGZK_10215 [Agromyces sp. MMS24-K17]|uniref:hypothetical protein n=1 Tax=Agromyces sp. MMS24-K17 TaxID=3372850 RepID=UPI003754D66F
MRSADLLPAFGMSAHWAPAVLAAAAACSDVVLPVVAPEPAVAEPAGRRGTTAARRGAPTGGLSERRVRVAFRRIVRRLEADGWPA